MTWTCSWLTLKVGSSYQTGQTCIWFFVRITFIWQDISQLVPLSDPSKNIIVEIKQVVSKGIQFILRVASFQFELLFAHFTVVTGFQNGSEWNCLLSYQHRWLLSRNRVLDPTSLSFVTHIIEPPLVASSMHLILMNSFFFRNWSWVIVFCFVLFFFLLIYLS